MIQAAANSIDAAAAAQTLANAGRLAGKPATPQPAVQQTNKGDFASQLDAQLSNNQLANLEEAVEKAEEVRDAFTQFVGTTVFGQMMKSMRQTVSEPAYFHGGQAEEMFQGQLDQAVVDDMTKSGGSPFAEAMFEQQFPNEARILNEAKTGMAPSNQSLRGDAPLAMLDGLRRR